MGRLKAETVASGIAIGNALIPALIKVMGVVNNVITPIAHFLQQHKTLTAVILGVVMGLGALAAILKITTIVMAAFDAVADANPFVLLALAIVALVVGIIYAWNHFKTFRDVVHAAMDGIKTAVMVAWHALEAAWHGIVTGVTWVWHMMQAAWNGIVSGVMWLWHQIEGAWNSVVSVTTTVWDAISGFFKKWWPLLLVIFLPFIAILVSIWNHFHKQIIGTVEEGWHYVTSFLKGAWHEIQSLAKGAWHLIQEYIVQPAEATWHFLVQIWNAVKPYLLSAWHTVAGYAQSAWNLVKKYIIDPITSTWHYLTGKFDDIKNYVGKKLHEAVTDVENIAKGFLKIGEDIINGIIQGVENKAGALFSSLKNVANDALKSAKSFLGIGSPSKLFSEEVGKWIPHGIADGVIRYAHVAGNAVKAVSAGLPTSLSVGGGSALGAGLGGYTGGLVGSGGGGGTVVIDIHDNHVMNDRDLDDLVNKVGRRVATLILPSGGVKIRM
jgi:phage-related protein